MKMKPSLQVGIGHTLTYRVPVEKTVPYLYPESALFAAMPQVFATGFMVGFMEWACMEALAPHLDEGERSVGTMINITHEAATPPGMTVTAKVRCVEVNGKRNLWEVEVHDEQDLIGRGTHERFVISVDKFNARLLEKLSRNNPAA
jgi:fluoroacetyl-CoA thioesterase